MPVSTVKREKIFGQKVIKNTNYTSEIFDLVKKIDIIEQKYSYIFQT